jgi:indole-3-glycerol phosphate synthase
MILETIVRWKKQEVKNMLETLNWQEWERIIRDSKPCKGFINALTERPKRSMGLIAEIKKASPSKGVIREDFNPVDIAEAYEKAGADCLSILTDQKFFQGANRFLQSVRATTKLPILRKDFIVDEAQIFEARTIGADAVLLIVACLSNAELLTFSNRAKELGMDVLVEVHDRAELDRALDLGFKLIGVNNRDLKTFKVDLKTTEILLPFVPKGIPLVSESGISTMREVTRLRAMGVRGVLIGETFMRQDDIEQAVLNVMGPILAR